MGSPIDNWNAYIYDEYKYPDSKYTFGFGGYICCLFRTSYGNWYGAIYLPTNHPDHHKTVGDIRIIYSPYWKLGALTFSDGLIGMRTPCITSWKFAVDRPKTKYRTFAYVKGQVQKLAIKILERSDLIE